MYEHSGTQQGYNNNSFNSSNYENREQSYKRSFDGPYGDTGNSPMKRSRQQGDNGEIEMRCLVPSKAAGGIIGTGGTNIKDMRKTFSAQVKIPDTDAQERVLIVNASIESCGEIILRILPIIDANTGGARRDRGRGRGGFGEKNFDRGDQQHIKLLVHQSQAGGIIGLKGFKIKELREKTGATIKVQQECCPHSTDRVCTVYGTPEVISSCVVLILKLLEVTPPKGPIENFEPTSYDDMNYSDFDDFNAGGNRFGGSFNMGRGGGRDRGRGGFGRGVDRFSERGGRGGFMDNRGRGGGGRGRSFIQRGFRGARGGRNYGQF